MIGVSPICTACLAEAARHGWLVGDGDIYADAQGHMSGRTEDRPDWQRLRRRVRRDESVVAVIVESLSRASRSVRDFFNFVEEMNDRGIALISVKERFDTSGAIGQAMLGMIAIVNQLESDLASERMRGQIEYKKGQGRHWGRTPFGCDREEVTGALKPTTETYRIDGTERRYFDSLARCYEVYARGRHGYKRLAQVLNGEGWRFRGLDGGPRPWDANNVRSAIMLNRVYAGWVPVSGHNKDRPEEYIKANYDPVLPVDLCDAVSAMVDKRSKPVRKAWAGRTRSMVYDYVLTGILYCAECGGRLKGHKHRGVRYYRHYRTGDCSQRRSHADCLERQALELLDRMRIPEDLVQDIIDDLIESYGPDTTEERKAEFDAIDNALHTAERELKRLVDIAVQTNLDTEVYASALQERNAEVESLRGRRDELARLAREERGDLEAVIERLHEIQRGLHQATPALQKKLLKTVFERIEVQTDEILRWTPRGWCRPFFSS